MCACVRAHTYARIYVKYVDSNTIKALMSMLVSKYKEFKYKKFS